MQSFGSSYRALIIGASGSIGAALKDAISGDVNCTELVLLSRSTHPGFSLEDEVSIAQFAEKIRPQTPFELIIDATGALTIDGHGPEKHLGALSRERLLRALEVNAVGPALLIKHFSPLLASGRSIYAKLSARVGSISDNRKGGWYGYRASKAALNMFLQTAAIEIQRRKPQAIIAALQPGTVRSPLSEPFSAGHTTLSPSESAQGLLAALDALDSTPGAQFIDYQGNRIGW